MEVQHSTTAACWCSATGDRDSKGLVLLPALPFSESIHHIPSMNTAQNSFCPTSSRGTPRAEQPRAVPGCWGGSWAVSVLLRPAAGTLRAVCPQASCEAKRERQEECNYCLGVNAVGYSSAFNASREDLLTVWGSPFQKLSKMLK